MVLRAAPGPKLVRGYYLSRTCFVPISYQGGPALSPKWAISDHSRAPPTPASISLFQVTLLQASGPQELEQLAFLAFGTLNLAQLLAPSRRGTRLRYSVVPPYFLPILTVAPLIIYERCDGEYRARLRRGDGGTPGSRSWGSAAGIARILHTPHETATGRSAELHSAFGRRTRKAECNSALRLRAFEMSGIGGFQRETACDSPAPFTPRINPWEPHPSLDQPVFPTRPGFGFAGSRPFS
jgi:hypothetical protein